MVGLRERAQDYRGLPRSRRPLAGAKARVVSGVLARERVGGAPQWSVAVEHHRDLLGSRRAGRVLVGARVRTVRDACGVMGEAALADAAARSEGRVRVEEDLVDVDR